MVHSNHHLHFYDRAKVSEGLSHRGFCDHLATGRTSTLTAAIRTLVQNQQAQAVTSSCEGDQAIVANYSTRSQQF